MHKPGISAVYPIQYLAAKNRSYTSCYSLSRLHHSIIAIHHYSLVKFAGLHRLGSIIFSSVSS
ncbi:MAG: hypothetical protein ACM3H8_08070, partial [Sphingobacteriales bacterium]